MIRTINLKGRTGRFDVPSFLLTDSEDLTLKLNASDIRVGKYVATIKLNNLRRVEYLGKDMSVTLTAEQLSAAGAGVLETCLEFRTQNGASIIIPSAKDENDKQGFFIEPLLIEKMDDRNTAVGWLSKIEETLANTNARVDAIMQKIKDFEDNGVPLIFEEDEEPVNQIVNQTVNQENE